MATPLRSFRQAYLRVNRYFIVAEYLVHTAARGSNNRTATDLDVAAYRPRAPGRGVRRREREGRVTTGVE